MFSEKNLFGSDLCVFRSETVFESLTKRTIVFGTRARCPLVEAARNGHFNVVAFLSGCEWTVTNARVEVDHADASQQALVLAAGQGADEVVEYLLDVADVTVDGQDSLSGETALTLASSNGHKSTAVLLLGRGARVSATNAKVSSVKWFGDDRKRDVSFVSFVFAGAVHERPRVGRP